MATPLPNLINRTRETHGDRVLYRYSNGLKIWAETFMKSDPLRILPIGTPQDTLLNYMLNFSGRIEGRDVFEPFAGSGVLGLMALKLGARRVDFLDINPRAVAFQIENAALNGFDVHSLRVIEGSIESFAPDRKYDLVFANPPFVPTPEGISGTLTSNGGGDGNRLASLLLSRINDLLKPEGEAFLYILQFENDDGPLIASTIRDWVADRRVELTRTLPMSFTDFRGAYYELFPESVDAINNWSAGLSEAHGDGLQLRHYVVHILPGTGHESSLHIADDLAEKYGEGLDYPGELSLTLAFNRVRENVIPWV